MKPERWQQIEKLFHAALEHDPSERAAFLTRECGADKSLRREVESLLASHEQDRRSLDAADIAADLLGGDQVDRKSTRLNSSHSQISYAVFCLKKKKTKTTNLEPDVLTWC